MKLTTKGRYAVNAMLDLALHDTNSPVTLADIAKRQEISLAYLEQLFAKLKKDGLVSSARGGRGLSLEKTCFGYHRSRRDQRCGRTGRHHPLWWPAELPE